VEIAIMKRFADEKESVVRAPLIVEPVVVQDTLVGVAVQHHNIAVLVVHGKRTFRFAPKAV
jgi:hypothetical protein